MLIQQKYFHGIENQIDIMPAVNNIFKNENYIQKAREICKNKQKE